MDDFIVDDDESDDTSHSGSDDYESDSTSDSDSSPGSSHRHHQGKHSTNNHSKGSRSRAAVAAQLDNAGFSDEFVSWAETEGLESRLLSDIGQRGTEASCKSLFVTALLEELVSAGHRTLVFSQSRVMLDILQVMGVTLCQVVWLVCLVPAKYVLLGNSNDNSDDWSTSDNFPSVSLGCYK